MCRGQPAFPHEHMGCADALHRIERWANSENALIYCNPCLGIPPILLDAPAHFFGIQILFGGASLFILLLISQ